MNKDQLLRMLDAFLSQSGLYHHEALPDDLLSLLRKSGIEAKFLNEFVKMQSQYNALGRAQAEQLRQYERIDDRLYSLHIDKGRKFNIRILYAYHSVTGQRILLHAFWERRSRDYESAIAVAYARLNDLEEDTL